MFKSVPNESLSVFKRKCKNNRGIKQKQIVVQQHISKTLLSHFNKIQHRFNAKGSLALAQMN